MQTRDLILRMGRQANVMKLEVPYIVMKKKINIKNPIWISVAEGNADLNIGTQSCKISLYKFWSLYT